MSDIWAFCLTFRAEWCKCLTLKQKIEWNKKDERITLRLPRGLRAELKKLAQENGRRFSNFIQWSLLKLVEEADAKRKKKRQK